MLPADWPLRRTADATTVDAPGTLPLAGGEYGIRGFIAAYDAETGEQRTLARGHAEIVLNTFGGSAGDRNKLFAAAQRISGATGAGTCVRGLPATC